MKHLQLLPTKAEFAQVRRLIEPLSYESVVVQKRRCSECGAVLSRYNPSGKCRPCLEAEEEKDPSKRCLPYGLGCEKYPRGNCFACLERDCIHRNYSTPAHQYTDRNARIRTLYVLGHTRAQLREQFHLTASELESVLKTKGVRWDMGNY